MSTQCLYSCLVPIRRVLRNCEVTKVAKKEHFNKRRKLLVNLNLSDANRAREKGDSYLAGSLTSGIKVEMNNQMWLKGEKVTFPLTRIKFTCIAPIIELVRSLFPPVSGRPLELRVYLVRPIFHWFSCTHPLICASHGSGHNNVRRLWVSVVVPTTSQMWEDFCCCKWPRLPSCEDVSSCRFFPRVKDEGWPAQWHLIPSLQF